MLQIEQTAVHQRAPQQPPQNIASVFVGRHYAVAGNKSASAHVINDNPGFAHLIIRHDLLIQSQHIEHGFK